MYFCLPGLFLPYQVFAINYYLFIFTVLSVRLSSTNIGTSIILWYVISGGGGRVITRAMPLSCSMKCETETIKRRQI